MKHLQRTVLVVDDNYINRQVLRKILASGYTVLEAENGAQALEVLRTQKELVSAVLLDLLMPVMDGYIFLRRCRKDADLAELPILITTQNEDENTEVQVLALGAADFLTKPYKPAVIRHRLANVIRLHEAATLINNVERDALTGVFNRDFFYREATEEMHRNPEGAYDLICTDIEKFKLVNDLFGVVEGDRLLKHLAAVLQKNMPPNCVCGRIGADTFVVLVTHRDTYETAMFEEIVRQLNEYPLSITLMVRFGVYSIKNKTVSMNAMCDRARLAIESIKGRYDAYFAYYDDSLRDRMLREQAIANSMELALAENQFHVYYQPKYNLKTREVVGAEALVRWLHPENGFMAPAQFIPLFEKNGFITDLDLFVWDKVCSHIRKWLDAGYPVPPISVNVSRVDIYNSQLPHLLMQTVNAHALTPAYLHLEITESAYTESPQQLIAIINELKNLGFLIEMDDFGTGYSSLNMISELPIDTLKLDMRFLQGGQGEKNNEKIIRFILSLAKWLNLTVVAEGIETEKQMLMLRNMDADYGQGYYFSRPLPRTEFEACMADASIVPVYSVAQTAAPSAPTDALQRRVVVLAPSARRGASLTEMLQQTYTVHLAADTSAVLRCMMEHEGDTHALVVDCARDARQNIALLEAVQAAQLQHKLPVVVLYAPDAVSEPLEALALEMGVAAYIPLPSDGQFLCVQISDTVAYAELEAARALQQQRAEEDALTGLLNTDGFEKRIKKYFSETRAPGEKAALLLLQTEWDTAFEAAPDNTAQSCAMRNVAQTLRKSFRGEDSLAFLQGGLFAVLAPSFEEARDLCTRMELLCHRVSTVHEEQGRSIGLWCCIGGCMCPEHGETYEVLYARAAEALAAAKQLGKGKCRLFGTDAQVGGGALFENMDWFLDEFSDGVMVCDAQTYEILYLNEPATHLTRHSKWESIGRKCHKLICNAETPCANCAMPHADAGSFLQQEMDTPETGRHFLLKGKRVCWNGRPAFIQYIQDDTVREVRKRMEQSELSINLSQQQALVQKLNETTRYLETILENLEGGIVILQATAVGCVLPTYFSSGFCRMLHTAQADLQALYGGDFLKSVWPQDAWRVAHLFREAAQSHEKLADVFRLRRDDGSAVWVSMNASTITDTNGNITYYVLFADMSKEKAAAGQARRSEQENLSKTLFLTGLSHDVRTPMNAILGVTRLARAEIDHKKTVLESLSVIEDSVSHLLGIINNVLQATHLGGGIVASSRPYFNLQDEMALLEAVLRPILAQKQQKLTVRLHLTHHHFYGESMREHSLCKQILECIAGGLPKKTALLLHAEEDETNMRGTLIRIYIEAENDAFAGDILFHLLETSEDALQAQSPKALAEARGGRIFVNKKHKAAVCIELPLQPVLSAEATPDAEEETRAMSETLLRGKRFLLAEDHPVNITVIRNMLERCGAVVEAVPNGRLACDCFSQSAPGAFAAVLMDMHMPDMDGYAAASALRASVHPDARKIPIIAVTADVFTDNERKAMVAGVDAYVTKPVTLPMLLQALQKGKDRRAQITAAPQ